MVTIGAAAREAERGRRRRYRHGRRGAERAVRQDPRPLVEQAGVELVDPLPEPALVGDLEPVGGGRAEQRLGEPEFRRIAHGGDELVGERRRRGRQRRRR
jgi:hypothetical protein